MKNILAYFLGALLLLSAVAHIVVPEFYSGMIPDFLPEKLTNILVAVLEAGIGVLLCWPRYRHLGGVGFCILMIVFLPVHVWDLFREDPVIGPLPVAIARLVFQFLFIYLGWRIFKKSGKDSQKSTPQ